MSRLRWEVGIWWLETRLRLARWLLQAVKVELEASR
jgi:hypothetical protein